MKITFFTASIETVIWRYYLMTVVVVLPFLVGMPYLAILGYPIFLSAFMGVSIKTSPQKETINTISMKSETIRYKKEVAA